MIFMLTKNQKTADQHDVRNAQNYMKKTDDKTQGLEMQSLHMIVQEDQDKQMHM